MGDCIKLSYAIFFLDSVAERGHCRRPEPLHYSHHDALKDDCSHNSRQPIAFQKILHPVLHKIRQQLHSEIHTEHLQVQTDQYRRSGATPFGYPHAENGSAELTVHFFANKQAGSGRVFESRHEGHDQGRDDTQSGDDARRSAKELRRAVQKTAAGVPADRVL